MGTPSSRHEPSWESRRARHLPLNFFDSLDRSIAGARGRGVDVIDLSKGNPDLPTPPHVVAELGAAAGLLRNQRYAGFTAKEGLRRAIAERYRLDHGVTLDPDTQVAVFQGSGEALMALPHALMDAGDTLLVPDPAYPPYLDAAALAGVGVRRLPLSEEDGYLPALDPASTAAWRGSRLLVLNYPNNPTGAVADEDFWVRAREAARREGVLLVNDFAYSHLDHSRATAVSALVADPTGEELLELGSLSKTYSMAGWRIGWAAGNADAVAALSRYRAVASSLIFGAVQDAAQVALSGNQEPARAIAAEYRARRDLVVGALRAGGWHVSDPAGTFFVWVRPPEGDHGVVDGEAVAAALLADAGVAVAPGLGFGQSGRAWVRLGLVQPRDVLTRACRLLVNWGREGAGQ